MRRWLLVLCALLGAVPLGAAWADGLYEARTIVTGMDQRSRPAGLSRALGLVLAKASGNPGLEADVRLTDIDPGPLLLGFAYLDRMSDIPKHDEQGSRDRPYDLVARFDPAAVDALLRGWGEVAWSLPRPPLGIDVTIIPRRGDPMPLRADTDSDERQRAALLAAADRFGLDVRIPATLPPLTPAPETTLHGTLAWSDAAAGWVARWRLEAPRLREEWEIEGVGFDAAYRNGLGGAALRLRPGPSLGRR